MMNDLKMTTMAQAFEILGLKDRRVTLEQIKEAKREQIKLYHPDRVAQLGPELKAVAEHKTKLINLAFDYLQANASKTAQATTPSPKPTQPQETGEAWRKRQQEEERRAQHVAKEWRARGARAAAEARERVRQAREAAEQAARTQNQFWQMAYAPFAFMLAALRVALRLTLMAPPLLGPVVAAILLYPLVAPSDLPTRAEKSLDAVSRQEPAPELHRSRLQSLHRSRLQS